MYVRMKNAKLESTLKQVGRERPDNAAEILPQTKMPW